MAAGDTETKADRAGESKSQVAARTPGGDAGKTKVAGAGGTGETKAAGAGGAGETKAAGAGAGFKITYAAEAEAGKRLEEQCSRVRKAVAEWRQADPGKPIQLVLGAQAWQWQRFGSSHWVYLDVFGRTGQGAPDFCADFNDLGQLGKAAAALAGQVDHIYLDPQVLKFSTWKKAHLDLFRAMLRPGGTFHLPLEQCGMAFLTLPPYQPEDASDPAELLAYAVIEQPADVLPRDYEVPRNLTDFPKDFQARAHALCMERLLKPAILGMLLDTFDVVEEETAEPEFLRRHPHRTPHAEAFYACRTEGKDS